MYFGRITNKKVLIENTSYVNKYMTKKHENFFEFNIKCGT
jgi:hypothetical protein